MRPCLRRISCFKAAAVTDSPMQMPAPDAAVIARRDEIAAALRGIVPGEGVIVAEDERRAYESDGLTAYRQPPLVVVLPSTVAQVARVLRYCHAAGDQGRAARRRHLAVGRRAAAGRRRPARHGQVQPHPRDRLRQPLRRGAARRHQSRHHPRGRGRRLLLRARSRRARSPARSAAMSRRIPAACIASNTGSPPTTCSASRWC